MAQTFLVEKSQQSANIIVNGRAATEIILDEFLIDFFFRTSIKRMEQEIEEKKNLTENFIRGMEFVRNVKSSNDDISEI